MAESHVQSNNNYIPELGIGSDATYAFAWEGRNIIRLTHSWHNEAVFFSTRDTKCYDIMTSLFIIN